MNGELWAISKDFIPMIEAAQPGGTPIALWAAGGRSESSRGTVAHLVLGGIIEHRQSWLGALFGGTSIEAFSRDFRKAIADPSVKAVLFEVDSPGGSVFGVDELSTLIYQSRGKKPIVAAINSLGASAAYWIASAADSIIMTPSGQAGSIGVYVVHADISTAAERAGVKYTIVSTGNNKTLGNELESLSTEARADMQKRVDQYGGMFERAVARNRGVTLDTVRHLYGQGLMYGAVEAKALGIVDRIGIFESAVSQAFIASDPRARLAALRRVQIREREFELLQM